jgi:hypothetical protein
VPEIFITKEPDQIDAALLYFFKTLFIAALKNNVVFHVEMKCWFKISSTF